MKKVRFETPTIAENFGMCDSDCHSPRPFESQLRSNASEPCYEFARVLPYSNDPVQRFETSNCSPYPSVAKTRFPKPSFQEQEPSLKPSNDLDLSLLDASNHEPRRPAFNKMALKSFENRLGGMITNHGEHVKPVLSAIDKNSIPPNVLVKDNSFFIRRENLDKYHVGTNLQREFNGLNMGKENNPYLQKAEIMKKGLIHHLPTNPCQNEFTSIKPIIKNSIPEPPSQGYVKQVEINCPCHHCVKPVENIPKSVPSHKEVDKGPCQEFPLALKQIHSLSSHNNLGLINCHCTYKPQACSHCYEPQMHLNHQSCACNNPNPPQNAVDKKTWAIEKFEKRKQSDCMEVEKQTNITKEKREPTVADLFKIIKLQNEQLQLLQDKVDKFISDSQQNTPTTSCSSDQVANDQVKMSIGVMTSFEMVRTSTVINKEVIKQTNDNQIQCNRSQISIKEVVSKPTLNFLDGIMPVNTPTDTQRQAENGTDKTLNDLSLYNVQVDNATTPNLSPEQTLYLDVRDYSESEASSNDQSNVGWTYYNKVMTHVNGMLQDSEMPSSASAMFRNMRQQCVNMQIDKSNISVTTSKRVKFGDDPLGIHQPHLYATDTSLKMNQLAAKYLKNVPVPAPHRVVKPQPSKPAAIDMSFATRNYMEKHKLLQGQSSKSPQAGEIPRFLDITALKQQPKLL